MITITFDLNTGLAKLSSTTTIKHKAQVPVKVVFSEAPGSMDGIKLALGTDAAPPTILVYTDTFVSENDTTWTGLLDCATNELDTAMTGKGPTAFNLELAVTLDGVAQVAPNLSVTVQPPIIAGSTAPLTGPSYYTKTEIDGLLATYVPRTVAGKYRIKTDGTVELWNATQSAWQSVTASGASGSETLAFDIDLT